ncbi:MAG: hypothetical protein MHM6MM_004578 [Cercozoa sp. M6MM]
MLTGDFVAWILLVIGAATLISLVVFKRPPPFGKHADAMNDIALMRRVLEYRINARVAWAVWEAPCLVWMLYGLAIHGVPQSWHAQLLCVMFGGHYMNRSVIYPLRLKSPRRVPLGIALCAMAFCVANGFVQYFAIFESTHSLPSTSLILLGLVLFVVGMTINLHADAHLRSLRQDGSKGYKIPRAGMFRYCSSAHYTGEILQWTGYALASGLRLHAVSFAVFTACNLIPRALETHRWYQQKFGRDYPSNRTAVLPFVL